MEGISRTLNQHTSARLICERPTRRAVVGFTLRALVQNTATLLLAATLGAHTVSTIMCVQCDTDRGDDFCGSTPPPPENCTACARLSEEGACEKYSHFNYCVTVRKHDENGTLLGVSRSCSPIQYINACFKGTDRSRGNMQVSVCNTVCDWDGCNGGTPTYRIPHTFLLPSAVSFILLYQHYSPG